MAPASGAVSGAGTSDTPHLYGSTAIGFLPMTGHPGVIVTLDGEVHPPGTPLLFADDLAAVRGDGVFETLLVRGGRASLFATHLSRMGPSAKLLDLPEPHRAAWRHAIELATQQWVAGADG